MSTMSDKEKQIQIALGTLNIPELIPIPEIDEMLKKGPHPLKDPNASVRYLIKANGTYLTGYVDNVNNVLRVNGQLASVYD